MKYPVDQAEPVRMDNASIRQRWHGLGYVAVAVVLFSTSPVLIRSAADYSPFEIAFGRMLIAAAAVMAGAVAIGVAPLVPRARFRRFIGYGLITALHFLLYIASLSFTTVAHSLAIVYTAPIFVTIFAALLLREPLAGPRLVGIPIATVGVAIMVGFEPAMDWQMAIGDLMALGSAVCFGLYSVAGRSEREQVPLFTYAGTVYFAAALWLLPVAILTYTGIPDAIGIGHTLYNASLRRTHPTFVNLVATQEVTGGVLLGALLLHEVPGISTLVGAAVTIVGVGAVLTLGSGRSRSE
jgi:drug/metabolite transporter (DMT)-like permease